MKFSQKLKLVTKVPGFKIKKHSPEILVTVGAIGTVAAGVMACVATTKLPDVLDECQARKNELEDFKAKADETNEAGEIEVSYTDDDYKKDQTKLAIRNAWEVAKIYTPAVCVELASLSMIFASNSIHRKRTASLAAAYATLDSMFKEYRKNVCETFGEDIDHDMRYGVKHEKLEVTEMLENGKTKTSKIKTDYIDKDPNDSMEISDYAKFYDESVPGWDDNADRNLTQLKMYQTYANNVLISQGYITLNEVYKIIGLKPTIAGQTIGWVYDPTDKNPLTSRVNFGIYKKNRANRRFVNGLESVILLDFNVHGDIINDPILSQKLNKLIASK